MTITPKPNPKLPNVPLWFSAERIGKATAALNSATELMEWAIVNSESMPLLQHENLETVASFVADVVEMSLHALERLVAQHKKQMTVAVPKEDTES